MGQEQPNYPPFTPALVLSAYAQGCFPMSDSRNGQIAWYSPDPRTILPLDQFHIPHGLKRTLKRDPYFITIDRCFGRVIQACAQPRPYQQETWINDEIIKVYTTLHELGYGHSIEAWQRNELHRPTDELVGGLYGLALGGAFFGESMFSTAPDASKVCLVHLVEHLVQRGYSLCDVQLENDHLKQFGIVTISREDYMRKLEEAIVREVKWSE